MATEFKRMRQLRGSQALADSNDQVLPAGVLAVTFDGDVAWLSIGDGTKLLSQIDRIPSDVLARMPPDLSAEVAALEAAIIALTADDIAETAGRLWLVPAERAFLVALAALGDLPDSAEPAVSGVLSGGVVSLASGTLVNIAAGAGVVIDGYSSPSAPARAAVSWGALANVSAIPGGIGADDATVYVGITNAGAALVIASPPTAQQQLDNIWLAQIILSQDQNAIAAIINRPVVSYTSAQLLGDYLRRQPLRKQGGGALSAAGGMGLAVSALMLWSQGVNWRIDKAAPHTMTVAQQSPADIVYMLGTGAILGDIVSEVAPGQYEPSPGSLADAVVGSFLDPAWTNQAAFMTPGGLAIVLRGTEVYETKEAALAGLEAEHAARSWPDDLQELSALVGWITVRADAGDSDFGDLSDPDVCEFTTAAQEVSSLGNQAMSRILAAVDFDPASDAASGDALVLEDWAGANPRVTTAPVAGGGGAVETVNGIPPDTNGDVPLALDDLLDVDAAAPGDGEVLAFDTLAGAWGPVPAGGGALVPIARKTATATDAAMTFVEGTEGADWSQYAALVLKFSNAQPTTDARNIALQVSTDGGGSWITTASYGYSNVFVQPASGPTRQGSGAAAEPFVSPTLGTGGQERAAGSIEVSGFGDTNDYTRWVGRSSMHGSDGLIYGYDIAGAYLATTVVDGIRFLFTSGSTIDSLTVDMYGVLKAS